MDTATTTTTILPNTINHYDEDCQLYIHPGSYSTATNQQIYNYVTTDKQDKIIEHLVIKSVKNQNMCTKGTKLRASKCLRVFSNLRGQCGGLRQSPTKMICVCSYLFE